MKNVRVVFVSFLVLTFSQFITAQSGRKAETPSPGTEILSPSQFAKCEKGLEEVLYISPRKIKDFGDELNRLGNCGYRLEKADKISLRAESTDDDLYVFAVVKLDVGNRYEYDWFGVRSPGEIVTQANIRAEKGFYLRKNLMFIADRCDTEDDSEKIDNERKKVPDDLLDLSIGSSGSIFIFERKNGVVKKREYRVLKGTDQRSKKALAENQKTLDEYIDRGYRPVGIYYLGYFDVFAIVVEKDDEIKPEGEYRILRYTYNATKLFTKLGEEGFKPLMVGWYFALLHRKNSEPVQVSFQSADNFSGIIKNLPKWSGAAYQFKGLSLYNVNCDVSENKLFFAVAAGEKAKKYEQRFLKMTNVAGRNKTTKRYDALRAAPEPEKLKEFQKLLNEGYVIRELFEETGTVGFAKNETVELVILFERQVNTKELKL